MTLSGLRMFAARTLGAALILAGVGMTAARAEDDPAAGTSYAPTFAEWCRDQNMPADRCASPTADDQARFARYLDKREAFVADRDKYRRQEHDFKGQFAKHDEPYRLPEN